MTDSDTTTIASFVVRSGKSRQGSTQKLHDVDQPECARTDPAVVLLRDWRRAQRVSLVLCRLQQRLERRIINALGFRGQPQGVRLPNGEVSQVRCRSELDELIRAEGLDESTRAKAKAQIDGQIAQWDAMDEEIGYSVAREAEVTAMTATLKLQDALPNTAARSLFGIIAKLEIVVGADREIGDATDFPWPHIDSVLRDLKKISGSLPKERPERYVVRADVARYWAIAVDLVRLEKASN